MFLIAFHIESVNFHIWRNIVSEVQKARNTENNKYSMRIYADCGLIPRQ